MELLHARGLSVLEALPACAMMKLDIRGETRFFSRPEALYEFIGQEMGRDVQEALKNLSKSDCVGECEETYRIEEHYQRMIRDLLEDLELLLKAGRIDRHKLESIIENTRKDL